MKTFLIIYGVIVIIGICVMAYGIYNAEEVPQDIDIYDL
jgi:hypothetical protein